MRSPFTILTIVTFLGSQTGCALNPPVMTWRDMLRDQPIYVRTQSGEEHHLRSWRIVDNVVLEGTEDSALVRIPLKMVTSVARDDTPAERVAKTTVFIAGVIGVVATCIYFLWAFRGPLGPGRVG